MNEITIFEKQFYEVLQKKISVNNFESWVYSTPEIESLYGEIFYFDLMNLNYRNKYIILELEKIIRPKIPYDNIETSRLEDLLTDIISDNGDLIRALRQLYDDYCDGYTFLRFLGLSYAANGLDDIEGNNEGLHSKEKEMILNKVQPSLKREATRILMFLKNGQIKVVGEHAYEDLRAGTDRIEITDINTMLNEK